MINPQPAVDYIGNNERSLKRLVRAIKLSKGQFSLNLVRCNYAELQLEMRQRLQAAASLEIRDLVLTRSAKTLYTAIKTELSGTQPLALMVSGFESVVDLEHLLVATNQVRDDFRKSFAFPLVLWVSDDVLKKLMRLAPDFSSWAGVPIQFTISTENLITLLTRETDALFKASMEVGAGRFPRNSALYPEVGSHCRWQLNVALKDLRDRGQEPTPALAASLQFVAGQDAYAKEEMLEARRCYEQSLAFWQQQNGLSASPSSIERQGCLLFYLGLWWRRWAVLHRADQLSAWRQSRDYYQQCIQVLQKSDRPELAAKFINALGEVLRRLLKSDRVDNELESVAKTAVELHQTYFDPIRLAYGYGLLAEVALSKANWSEAQLNAERSLQTNDRPPESTPAAQKQYTEERWARQHYRSLYLLLLAQSQNHGDSSQPDSSSQIEQAVKTLNEAKESCNHAYDPVLYTRILEALRDLYYRQGDYVQAFETKRQQQSIEQQYGLRAFIGAVRLQPARQVINPAIVPVELPDTENDGKAKPGELPPQSVSVAQEIAASGRYQDVEELIKRLSTPRYNLTIIHGQSGVGKSSIINAGLIPALKQNPIGDRKVLSIVLRVYQEWIKDLGECLTTLLAEKGVQNSTPGLGKISNIQPLIDQLRDNADRHSLLTVLVFDQFEEFFFTFLKPRDRRPFFEFLHQCLTRLSFVKVVLSLREDYLHYLLEGSVLYTDEITNDILSRDKRYPLGNFSVNDAKLIIERLTQRSEFHLEPDLAEQLVQDLSAELQAVRPIELQIVGSQLQTSDISTLQQYQALGLLPKEKLVEQFLEQVIQDCGPENKQAATLILYLLTDDKGTRPLKTQPELLANLKVWDLPASSEKIDIVLDILVMSGLVLEIPETPVNRYQLVHDYLSTLVRQKLNQEVENYKLNQQLEKDRERYRRQNEKARAEEHKQRKRLLIFAITAIFLGLPAIVLAAYSFYQKEKAAIAEVDATTALSSSQLTANNQLEALKNSIKAGVKLKNQLSQPDAVLLNLIQNSKTISNLMATVYTIQEHNRFIGHRSWGSSISFSPATKTFASGSADGTIILWDRNGKRLKTVKGHESGVNSVSFSPDGQRLASASDDKTIKLWDLEGNLLKTFKGHQFSVTGVSFSPDGQRLASASDDYTVKLWDMRKNQAIATFRGHTDRVKAVSFSRDGTIATASWDGTVRLWNQNGDELKRLSNDTTRLCEVSKTNGTLSAALDQSGVNINQLCREHNTRFTSVSFSQDGKTIAAGSWDNTVKLWYKDGKLLQTLSGHSDRVTSVSFSPDGKTIVSASNDGTVKLWDRVTGIVDRTLKISGVIYASLVKAQTLVSTGADSTIKLWQLNGIAPETIPYETPVTSVSFSPDGHWMASASKSFAQDLEALPTSNKSNPDFKDRLKTTIEGQIKLWSVGAGRSKAPLAAGNFARIKFSPNSQTIASAENSIDPNHQVKRQVKLWSIDGELLNKLEVRGEIADVGFSPDSNSVVIAENVSTPDLTQTQGSVKLWNIKRNESKPWIAHSDKINSLSVSKNGTIATASNDATVKLWTSDGQLIKTLRGHTNAVNSASFSPDGKTLASASTDTTIRLWSLQGQELRTLTGNIGSVFSVDFSQDGTLLVSGSDDGTVRVWNVVDGALLSTLQKSDRQVNSVSFSPQSNNLIASAGNDNQVSLWQFDLNLLIGKGCDWLKTYLNTEQVASLNNEQAANDKELCPISPKH